jgi:hypothetical protein
LPGVLKDALVAINWQTEDDTEMIETELSARARA